MHRLSLRRRMLRMQRKVRKLKKKHPKGCFFAERIIDLGNRRERRHRRSVGRDAVGSCPQRGCIAASGGRNAGDGVPYALFWWKIWRFTKESLPLLRQAFAYALGWVDSVGSEGAGEGVGAEVSGGSVGLGSTRAMILSRDL